MTYDNVFVFHFEVNNEKAERFPLVEITILRSFYFSYRYLVFLFKKNTISETDGKVSYARGQSVQLHVSIKKKCLVFECLGV